MFTMWSILIKHELSSKNRISSSQTNKKKTVSKKKNQLTIKQNKKRWKWQLEKITHNPASFKIDINIPPKLSSSKIPVHVAHLDLEDAAPELQAPLFRLNVTGRKKLVFDIYLGKILAKHQVKTTKKPHRNSWIFWTNESWNVPTQRS